jgi:hypothetical protein
MKAKTEKEDKTSDAFCSLKVPIDHDDKESKTDTTKVKIYDSGSPEEFLKWWLILAEQFKNNSYTDNPDNVMNLAQAMLAGRSLEAELVSKVDMNYDPFGSFKLSPMIFDERTLCRPHE